MSYNDEENVDPLDDDMLLDEIVRALVSQPHDVKVTTELIGSRKILTVAVAPVDRGRVIGREGKVIRMLESLMDSIGHPRGIRIEVRMEGSFHVRQNRKPQGKPHGHKGHVEVSHVR